MSEKISLDSSVPKTKIEAENKGYFAVLEDSEGNHVGIYEK